MQVQTIRIPRVEQNASLKAILDASLGCIQKGDIVCITSKIISLCQGRIVPKQDMSKIDLIRQEADKILATSENPYGLYLTIKNDTLIPSAGIDESNAGDFYILLPEKIQETSGEIWTYLREKHHISDLGVVITDSHTTLMRRGVTGIALGWCGFEPLYSYVNKIDLHDKPLRVTQTNIIDALATTAVFVMGEGNEQTPIALIRQAPKIIFQHRLPTIEEIQSTQISMDEDLYGSLLKAGNWIS